MTIRVRQGYELGSDKIDSLHFDLATRLSQTYHFNLSTSPRWLKSGLKSKAEGVTIISSREPTQNYIELLAEDNTPLAKDIIKHRTIEGLLKYLKSKH